MSGSVARTVVLHRPRRGPARSINPFEVGAQSVANIAPSAVIAFGPAAMAGSAGNGAWFSFLLGTAIALVIASSIVAFARRRAGVGSLYSLIRLALGPSGAFVTGWALFIGVVAIASGSLAGAGFFAQSLPTCRSRCSRAWPARSCSISCCSRSACT